MQRSNAPSTIIGLTVLVLFLVLAACAPQGERQAQATAPTTPQVTAADPVEAGRYLVIVAGCNDCHTEGYLQTEGDVPEPDWLTGSVIGWQGPWGTTYPSNLRLLVQQMSEDGFVQMLRTRKALPPMPWMNVNRMSEVDARAVYRYIRHLGPKGSKVPTALPPGQEPETPYLILEPQHLERLEAFLAKEKAES